MEELLRDSIWQFIGAIIGIVALLTSIILSLLSKKRKKLTYEFSSPQSVISINSKYHDDLKVYYKNDEVTNLTLLNLRISNTGSIAIQKGDFEEPLNIELNDESSFISAEVIQHSPLNLKVDLTEGSNKITILPLLMNQSDTMTLKFLINNYKDEPKIDGRIVGISKFNKKNTFRTGFWSGFISSSTAMLGIFALMTTLDILIGIPIAALGIGLLIYFYLKHRKNSPQHMI